MTPWSPSILSLLPFQLCLRQMPYEWEQTASTTCGPSGCCLMPRRADSVAASGAWPERLQRVALHYFASWVQTFIVVFPSALIFHPHCSISTAQVSHTKDLLGEEIAQLLPPLTVEALFYVIALHVHIPFFFWHFNHVLFQDASNFFCELQQQETGKPWSLPSCGFRFSSAPTRTWNFCCGPLAQLGACAFLAALRRNQVPLLNIHFPTLSKSAPRKTGAALSRSAAASAAAAAGSCRPLPVN